MRNKSIYWFDMYLLNFHKVNTYLLGTTCPWR